MGVSLFGLFQSHEAVIWACTAGFSCTRYYWFYRFSIGFM